MEQIHKKHFFSHETSEACDAELLEEKIVKQLEEKKDAYKPIILIMEKVIEHLQQIAAEENQNSNKDDSKDLTGNEDAEGTHKANEEEPKTERTEGQENEDMTQDYMEIQSPGQQLDKSDASSINQVDGSHVILNEIPALDAPEWHV
ncbi:transcription factor TFIIIB component B''-like [Forsythia ovata]|uniref:Transcription factor TFIIIB component B''-like n=1 Tax=Forsythia ovata TaxID=205694 RepID=A0ABD1VLR9_9LAMI